MAEKKYKRPADNPDNTITSGFNAGKKYGDLDSVDRYQDSAIYNTQGYRLPKEAGTPGTSSSSGTVSQPNKTFAEKKKETTKGKLPPFKKNNKAVAGRTVAGAKK